MTKYIQYTEQFVCIIGLSLYILMMSSLALFWD